MNNFLSKPHMFTMDDQGRVAPCWDTMEWGEYMEHSDRKVALTTIGRVNISTVFLGLDHNHWEGPPLIFETMIWVTVPEALDKYGISNHGREWLDGQQRYSTLEEARQGHAAIEEGVKERLAAGWQPWLLEDKDADAP